MITPTIISNQSGTDSCDNNRKASDPSSLEDCDNTGGNHVDERLIEEGVEGGGLFDEVDSIVDSAERLQFSQKVSISSILAGL